MASDSVPPTMPLTVVGYTTTQPKHSPSHNLKPAFLIPVTVVAVAVTASFALYFLIRYFRRYFRHPSPPTAASAAVFSSSGYRISPEITAPSAVDSLPLFAFSSVTRRSSSSADGGDCAVCLSKFEQRDLLRLLPLCCHAFHAECIDVWLRSNLTCPLCRSAVFASGSDVARILRSSSSPAGDSFRVEIGSISRRGTASSAANATVETRERTYSVGEFAYLVNDDAEIPFSQARRRIDSCEKNDATAVDPPAASLAGEVGGGRSWKDDYDLVSASILSTLSFRSSGRFFSGSSRRSDVVPVGDYDLESNRFGEEISEMFRWLSVA